MTERDCAGCTLCCKVLGIAEIEKPPGQWCTHCKAASGCGIYETRPQECRDFVCGYLAWPALGDHWLPARCKMIVTLQDGEARLNIHVDPASPGAWRREPYFSDIKTMAKELAKERKFLIVYIGRRAVALVNTHEYDLGIVEDGEQITVLDARLPDGTVAGREVVKLKADDPRLAGAVIQ